MKSYGFFITAMLLVMAVISGCTAIGASVGSQFNPEPTAYPASTIGPHMIGERVAVRDSGGGDHAGLVTAVYEDGFILTKASIDFTVAESESLQFESTEYVMREASRSGTYVGATVGFLIDAAVAVSLFGMLETALSH